jgi:heat shock protein HslJ
METLTKTLRQKLFELANTTNTEEQKTSTPKPTPMTSLEKAQAENKAGRARVNEKLDGLDTKKTTRAMLGVLGGGLLYGKTRQNINRYTGQASVKGNEVTGLGRSVINKTGYRRFKPV